MQESLDDLCRNLFQTYQSHTEKITGRAVIYMPIKQEPNYCFYSIVDVRHNKPEDYMIYKTKIRSLLQRHQNSNTINLLRYPEVCFFSRPTKKQKVEIHLLFCLNIYSYYMAYQIRNREEKQKRRTQKNQEQNPEEHLNSIETIQ